MANIRQRIAMSKPRLGIKSTGSWEKNWGKAPVFGKNIGEKHWSWEKHRRKAPDSRKNIWGKHWGGKRQEKH